MYVANAVVLIIILCEQALSQERTCFVHRSLDPDQSRRLRWALPFEEQDRCTCTTVLATPEEMRSCGFSSQAIIKYWFTDEPFMLVQRSVWKSELLKYLLDCPYEDYTKPSITCPADKVESNDIVTWNKPLATDNIVVVEVICEPSSGSQFVVGGTSVTCTATDDAGNGEQCSFYVVVDQIAPVISCPSTIFSSNNAVTWGVPSATDNVDSFPDVLCSPSSGNSFDMGETRVTCIATDDAGNQNDSSFSIIIDQVSPELICPSGTLYSSSNEVTFSAVSATDNIDVSPDVICEPSSGSFFASDVTTNVMCTATDDSGNEDTCNFDVFIDQVDPAITCPTNINSSDSVVVWNVPTATDNIDAGVDTDCSPSSGSSFDLGLTTVTCVATDDAGNEDICTFVVFIDQEAPLISCPANISSDQAEVTWADPSATDNVDATPDVSCVPSSGSSFDVGETIVTCTATDHVGNQNNCSFFVMADYVLSKVICPPDMTLPSGLVPNYPQPTVIGDYATVECAPIPGTNVGTGQRVLCVCITKDGSGNTLSYCSFTFYT